MFCPLGTPPSSRRLRRPSHRCGMQACEITELVDPRTARPPAHPRAQLQHPRPRVRIGRDQSSEEGGTHGGMDAEAQCCSSGQGDWRQSGVSEVRELILLNREVFTGAGWG